MSKRILIFDDDKEILLLCKAILGRLNYQVETRERCEAILHDVIQVQPDLILMDLWIPSIGGEKAIELLRADIRFDQLPVILFSANADIRIICDKVKANGYIEKPFDINRLIKVIHDQLKMPES